MNKHLYIYNYIPEFEQLAKCELNALLNGNHFDYHILTDNNIETDLSLFVKYKFDLIEVNKCFDSLVKNINDETTEDFLIQYINCPKQEKISRNKEVFYCKEIGMKFVNEVNFNNPKIIYGITKIDSVYYFGILHRNNKEYKKRNKKPISYSNSLDIHIAKSSINIVTKGNKQLSIVDPCCGVGTVVIEGLAQNYNIVGYDINYKVVNNANYNLNFFNLSEVCQTCDIKNLNTHYDCAIIDIPYGLFSLTTDEQTMDIIKSSKNIANNVLIISSSDIKKMILDASFKIVDIITVSKKMNRDFKRYLYILKSND